MRGQLAGVRVGTVPITKITSCGLESGITVANCSEIGVPAVECRRGELPPRIQNKDTVPATGVSGIGRIDFGMRSKSGKKIAVEGPQRPLGGLEDAFANLDIPADLPEGPTDNPVSEPNQESARMGRVVLRREKARRGGKSVIVVDDFAEHLTKELIESIANKLRSACGCGGTVRHRAIEVQGDHAGKVREFLTGEGFRVDGVR